MALLILSRRWALRLRINLLRTQMLRIWQSPWALSCRQPVFQRARRITIWTLCTSHRVRELWMLQTLRNWAVLLALHRRTQIQICRVWCSDPETRMHNNSCKQAWASTQMHRERKVQRKVMFLWCTIVTQVLANIISKASLRLIIRTDGVRWLKNAPSRWSQRMCLYNLARSMKSFNERLSNKRFFWATNLRCS